MPERESPPKGAENEAPLDAFKILTRKLLRVPREEVLDAERREKSDGPKPA